MGALLKLPFFTTNDEKNFFANLGLTSHSWSPYVDLQKFYHHMHYYTSYKRV